MTVMTINLPDAKQRNFETVDRILCQAEAFSRADLANIVRRTTSGDRSRAGSCGSLQMKSAT
jgi:hypothetical protein